MDSLADNLARVRDSIRAACRRAARLPEEVLLVAVTKYAEPPAVAELLRLGLADLGENRVQRLQLLAAQLGATLDDRIRTGVSPGSEASLSGAAAESAAVRPRWHMIGHLQRNKVRPLLAISRIVQSVDSIRLAAELESEASRLDARVSVLMEVNTSAEAAKTGAAPRDAAALAEAVARSPHLRLRGLMTMAPYDDPAGARRCFAALRELRESLVRSGAAGEHCRELSMGMSGDYEIAIEEGATIVRVGSALFKSART